MQGLAQQPGQQRDKGHADQGNAAARDQLLHALALAAGVILSITLQQEGYGNDNPGAKSQGMKQLMAGGGVALIGMTLVPLLSGLFG